jgi:predicted phage terminase large subunit-like protein
VPRVQPSSSPFLVTQLERVLERWDAGTLSPAEWNRKFLPLHFSQAPAPFHQWLSDLLSTFHVRRGSRLGLIAPRESAKTTWITFAHVLRCALEGREQYSLILSDTQPKAEQFLQSIRDELADNPQLAAVYGTNFTTIGFKKSSATHVKNAWARDDQIRLPNGCQIQAIGRGGSVRGSKKREVRPSLVICDDPQSNKNIGSEEVRTSALNWFLQEVIPAGSPTTNYISVGSALHRDAVAVRVQSLPGWESRTFAAMLSWPERLDLWAEWERLATDLADDNRNETAAAFLEANRAEMERGGKSYWPARWPVSALMARRAEIGHEAFRTEYQGIPGRLPGSEWPSEYFDGPGFWFNDWPTDLVKKVIALDPSKGISDMPRPSSPAGDFQAHALLGLAKNGDLYVDCVLTREPVEEMCLRTCELAREWIRRDKKPIDLVVLEDNGTMGFMGTAMQLATSQTRIVLPWECLTQSEPKPTRIRAVSAYLATRRIRVRNTAGGRQLVEQWRDWPQSQFDDACDAVATAIRGLEIMQGESDG